MIFFKLIFKELFKEKKTVFLFTLNISLGLCGFMALESLKKSLGQTLYKHSKTMMGGDLSVSARRPLAKEEIQTAEQELPQFEAKSKIVESYSMVSAHDFSRLVHVKAVEEDFPFYGKFQLKGSSPPAFLHQQKTAWVYPELLSSLGLKVGDQISLGAEKFKVTDVVEEDPLGNFSMELAPRIYISLKYLKETKLIQYGSLAWHTVLYKTPSISPHQLESARNRIFEKLRDPQIRVNTHKNASENTARLIHLLSDFLSLASLCALFLACAGIVFLFRSYIQSKVYHAAVLSSLGIPFVSLIYLGQALILLCLGFVCAVFGAALLLPLLKWAVKGFFPLDIHMEWVALGWVGFLALGILLCFCLPSILNIRKASTSILLKKPHEVYFKKDIFFFLPFIFGFICLWGLAVLQSHSYKIGSFFMLLFVSAGGVLAGLAWGGITLFKYVKCSHLSLRWALRDLNRYKFSSIFCFLALSLGISLLNLVSQIRTSLSDEIRFSHSSSNNPQLFLFNIQEDQVQPLRDWATKDSVDLRNIHPMIQSRLVLVNGKNFNKGHGGEAFTREEQRSTRFRNRGMNLSYRKTLSSSEKIVRGEDFFSSQKIPSDGMASISLERRFAQRLNLKLGDTLTFEVEGERVSGVIRNFRKVRWLSFQPNFFILFEGSALADFPKTFLAVMAAAAEDQKYHIQNSIVSKFPNISLLDVSRVSDRLLSLSSQMILALKLMTVLCVLAGFAVFYSICVGQAQARVRDISLLKALGASFRQIQFLFFYQYGLLSFLACFFGLLISFAVSYVLSVLLFHSSWAFSPWLPMGYFAGGVLLSLIVVYVSTRTVLNTSTRKWLS